MCAVMTNQLNGVTERTVQDLKQFQLDDEVVRPLLKAAKESKGHLPAQLKERAESFICFSRSGINFTHCHGEEKWAQLVVPLVLQKEILHDLHRGAAGGDLGEDKIIGRLYERFYWPRHTEDARKWCQKCPERTMRKTPELTNVHSGYSLQLIAMDLLGPLPEFIEKFIHPSGF